jgi:hypothetical protein
MWARRLSISGHWQHSNPGVVLMYVVVASQKPDGQSATMNFPRISSISYEFDG